jgi:hypothetical protein
MPMNFPWLTMQMVSAPPIRAAGVSVTPYARVLRLNLGQRAGLIWSRPGPLEVTWPSGAKQWVEVRDVSREVVLLVWALGAVLSLWWWLAGRTAH